MALGWQQLLLVLAIVLVLFGGRGRISSLMGDMAKGIRSFRQGLGDEDGDKETVKTSNLSHEPGETVETDQAKAAKSE
ncbi:MAG: twin-arginine translocase TatA/TatE family subunit [Pseudomonadota bacterium]